MTLGYDHLNCKNEEKNGKRKRKKGREQRRKEKAKDERGAKEKRGGEGRCSYIEV